MVRKMSRIKIELEKLLKEKKISKTQLCYACRIQRTQLNNYCKNKIVRVDLSTLARICDYIGCGVADILVLEPDDEASKAVSETREKEISKKSVS